MTRRAVLIFAEQAKLDLARRRLPLAALPLLPSPAIDEVGKAHVHIFGSRAAQARTGERFHLQHGRNFGERLEGAIETLTALGYAEIVVVGRDCPALVTADVVLAFARLCDHRLVLGPDHRGGCYLIGFRAEDRALLQGIRWKRNTDCAELTARAGTAGVALLPVKHDIDSWADLRLLKQTSERVARIAAFLLVKFCAISDTVKILVHAAAQFVRTRMQMPPPAFAG